MTFDKVETDILEWRRHVWIGQAASRYDHAAIGDYSSWSTEEVYINSVIARDLIADYREGDRVER